MQQLTLQFDGYADSRPVIDVSTTKQRSKVSICSHAGNKTFPHWEQIIPTLGIITALRSIRKKAILLVQTTLMVGFCFALLFLAAIIGG